VLVHVERDGLTRRPARNETRDPSRDLAFDEPPEACFVERPVVSERSDEGGEDPGKRKIL
jgi:hypothetical protein